MRNDEFNNVNITNDKETFTTFEFGKTQNVEFSSHKENVSNPNRDELNAVTNKNNENVKLGTTRTNNNDLIDKSIQTSESAAAAASSSSASSAAATTSSATATAGAASAGVVAATAVVAVTVVSATVGVNIYAQCHFEYLKVSHNTISYSLVLESDLIEQENEGNLQYRIWVEDENKSYYQYNELSMGTNTGDFYNLSPKTDYVITVASLSTVGGEELRGLPIYTSTVTTADTSAHVSINYLRPGLNEIGYELELEVNEDDDNQYAIWAEDGAGDIRYDDLIPGTNEGVFTDLMPETTYTISVAPITFDEDEYPIKGIPVYETTIATITAQATATFSYLQASETRLDYEVDLEVVPDNTNNYAIWLESTSDGYYNYNTLNVGDNTGTFAELTPDTEYTLSVAVIIAEATAVTKGEVIYEDTIRTNASTVNPYMSFNWNKTYDLQNNSIEIELSFEDPNEIYSDLRFEISDEEGNTKTFNLAKQQGKQTLYGSSSSVTPGGLMPFRADEDVFDFTSKLQMSYVFYYLENGVVNSETSESGFILKNKDGEFTGVNFDGYANYRTNSFELSLDYYDPNDLYSDFQLEITNAVGTYRVYELEKTIETQTICGDRSVSSQTDDTMDFSNPNEFFTIDFKYTVSNSADPVTIGLMSQGAFIDTTGSVVGLTNFEIFEGANFDTNTFYVQITYQDDLNKLDQFSLYLSGGGESHTFTLEKTTSKQSVVASWESSGNAGPSTESIDLGAGEFEYTFSYTIYGNLAHMQGEILFVDEVEQETINDIQILQSADLNTQEFEVDVDIDNTSGLLESARVVLTDSNNSQLTKSFTLSLTKSTQSFNANASDLRIRGRTFDYEILYTSTNSQTERLYQDGRITFTDAQNRQSTVNSVTLSSSADYNLKKFKASISMVDDFNVINPTGNFIITQGADEMTGNPGGTYSAPITLNPNITGEQTIDFSNFEDLDLSSDSLSYQITYVDTDLGTVNGPADTVSFSGAETYIEGVNSDFAALPNNGNYYLPLTLEYNDPLNIYSSTFELVTVAYDDSTGEETAGETIGIIEKTSGLQLIDVTDFIDEHDPNDTYSMIGLVTDNGLEGMNEGEIEVASALHVSAGYFESLEIDSSEPTLNLQLYMYAPASPALTSLQLVFMDNENGQWQYDLEVSFDYFNNMYTIDLTDNQDYQTLLAYFSNGVEFNVQIAYQDANYTADWIYIYSGVTFSVI